MMKRKSLSLIVANKKRIIVSKYIDFNNLLK